MMSILALSASAKANLELAYLNINIQGSGKVVVEKSSGDSECEENECRIKSIQGETVLLRPEPVSSFRKWAGACAKQSDSDTCSIELLGEETDVVAQFEKITRKKPFLKKAKRMTTRSLAIIVGCGDNEPCSLEISGYLRRKGRPQIEPIYLSLAAREKRKVNIIAGSDNTAIRNNIKKSARKKERVKMFVRVANTRSKLLSGMAINEKPACAKCGGR